MLSNRGFLIYLIASVIITTYFIIDCWFSEKQFISFIMTFIKSKRFYFLFLNLAIVFNILICKSIIYIFFNQIRTSELEGVIDKLKYKLLSLIILLMTIQPNMTISILLILINVFFLIFINMIAFNRADYLIKAENDNRKDQIKMCVFYIFIVFINNIVYFLVSSRLNNSGINFFELYVEKSKLNINVSLGDLLIFCIFTCEIIYIQMKLIVRLLKFVFEMTELSFMKSWEYNKVFFAFLNLLRYSFKSYIEIKFCYILILTGVLPVFLIIDIFFTIFHLYKKFEKIYNYIKLKRAINSLEDYIIDKNLNTYVNNCICLEEVEIGKKLPSCGHVYHLNCLK